MRNLQLVSLALLAALSTSILVAADADARRAGVRGCKGAAGGYHHKGQYGERAGIGGIKYGHGGASLRGARWNGPNGGSGSRAGFNAFKRGEGAIHASGSQGNTAAGGTWKRGGMTGWKNGEGAFHQSAFSGTSANGGTLDRAGKWNYQHGVGGSAERGFNATAASGASASGYKNHTYDATTGSGSINKGRDYNTKDGQSYGYDASTTYTKGEGFTTTVDRQNKPDYTIDYDKGSKPVITPVPTTP